MSDWKFKLDMYLDQIETAIKENKPTWPMRDDIKTLVKDELDDAVEDEQEWSFSEGYNIGYNAGHAEGKRQSAPPVPPASETPNPAPHA